MTRPLSLLPLLLLSAAVGRAQDTLYNSTYPKLPVTMQYPTAWRMVETEGTNEPYASFELLGPRSSPAAPAPTISVTVHDPGKPPAQSALEYLDRTIVRMKELSDRTELVARGAISYWGENVPSIDLVSMLPVPPGALEARWTAVRERRYAIVHAGSLWTFVYRAPEADFARTLPVFQHLMDTFFFNK